MKTCPFCAEQIQNQAVKCRYCGEFLDKARLEEAQKKLPWYFRKSVIVIAFLCVGPLMLPLLWWRPQTRSTWKVGLTAAILIITYFLLLATMASVRTLQEYYELLKTV